MKVANPRVAWDSERNGVVAALASRRKEPHAQENHPNDQRQEAQFERPRLDPGWPRVEVVRREEFGPDGEQGTGRGLRLEVVGVEAQREAPLTVA
jgi:hypothetical protein